MRAAGVRTFEDAEEYEAEKRKHLAESGRTGEWSHRQAYQTGMEDSSMLSQVACHDGSGWHALLLESLSSSKPSKLWKGRAIDQLRP